MGKFVDLTGKKFGRLTVIKRSNKKSKNGSVLWECKCECGNQSCVSSQSLKSGRTVSCGCYGKEIRKQGTIKANKERAKHGMYGTRFYRKWDGMKGRCNRENHSNYEAYGGRGIQVCDKWNTFEGFYEDMYESYIEHCKLYGEDNTTIERIDVDGNYCKENCTWATWKEQYKNKQDTIHVVYEGEETTLIELREKYGVSKSALWGRYNRGTELIREDEKDDE